MAKYLLVPRPRLPRGSSVRPDPAIVVGTLLVFCALLDQAVKFDDIRILPRIESASCIESDDRMTAHHVTKLIRGTIDADDQVSATLGATARHLLDIGRCTVCRMRLRRRARVL